MLKHNIIWLVLAAFTSNISSAAGLKGTIKNGDKNQTKLFLYSVHGDMVRKLDSCTIKKDQFKFSPKSKSGAFERGIYRLGFSATESLPLILGSEDVMLDFDAKNAGKSIFQQSKENAAFLKFRELGERYQFEMRVIETRYRNLLPMAQSEPKVFEQKVMDLRKKVDSLNSDQQEKYKQWQTVYADLFFGKMLRLYIFDPNATAEDFISRFDFEDEENLRTDAWENRISNFLQRFGQNDADQWVALGDQVISYTREGTLAREVALRSVAMALKPLEESGMNASFDVAKRYSREFPSTESALFVKRFNPGPPGVGEIAIDIALPDREGKIQKLSDLKGKVVLLDFWASWCGPCRHENPNVVKAYKRFSSKGFTVFSVSLDNSKDKWLAAITKDGLEWENHVSDLKGWSSEGAALYQVRGIPATFLIDKNGKIVAKNLRGSALEAKLQELLGP